MTIPRRSEGAVLLGVPSAPECTPTQPPPPPLTDKEYSSIDPVPVPWIERAKGIAASEDTAPPPTGQLPSSVVYVKENELSPLIAASNVVAACFDGIISSGFFCPKCKKQKYSSLHFVGIQLDIPDKEEIKSILQTRLFTLFIPSFISYFLSLSLYLSLPPSFSPSLPFHLSFSS